MRTPTHNSAVISTQATSLTCASFAWPIRVYWEDTDGGGVVYYANYLKFMERARTEWLRAQGLEQRHLEETTGGVFVVSEANVKYLQPARLDDALTITVKVRKVGHAAVLLEQVVHLQPDGETGTPCTLCTGTLRVAWVDKQTFRPARMPQQVHATLVAQRNTAEKA